MKCESNQDHLSRLDCNYCPLQRTNLATTTKKKVWENQDLRFQINFIGSTWARRDFQSSRRWTKKGDSFHRQRTYLAWLKASTFFLLFSFEIYQYSNAFFLIAFNLVVNIMISKWKIEKHCVYFKEISIVILKKVTLEIQRQWITQTLCLKR